MKHATSDQNVDGGQSRGGTCQQENCRCHGLSRLIPRHTRCVIRFTPSVKAIGL